jgi:hypothetical protein
MLVYIASLLLIALVVAGFLIARIVVTGVSGSSGLTCCSASRRRRPRSISIITARTRQPSREGPADDRRTEIAQMQGGIPDQDAERENVIAWMESIENGSAQLEDGVIR